MCGWGGLVRPQPAAPVHTPRVASNHVQHRPHAHPVGPTPPRTRETCKPPLSCHPPSVSGGAQQPQRRCSCVPPWWHAIEASADGSGMWDARSSATYPSRIAYCGRHATHRPPPPGSPCRENPRLCMSAAVGDHGEATAHRHQPTQFGDCVVVRWWPGRKRFVRTTCKVVVLLTAATALLRGGEPSPAFDV